MSDVKSWHIEAAKQIGELAALRIVGETSVKWSTENIAEIIASVDPTVAPPVEPERWVVDKLDDGKWIQFSYGEPFESNEKATNWMNGLTRNLWTDKFRTRRLNEGEE